MEQIAPGGGEGRVAPWRAVSAGRVHRHQHGAAEQWIKKCKNAVAWNRLSCHRFAAKAVRLHLHVLAYKLANFLRSRAYPARSSNGR